MQCGDPAFFDQRCRRVVYNDCGASDAGIWCEIIATIEWRLAERTTEEERRDQFWFGLAAGRRHCGLRRRSRIDDDFGGDGIDDDGFVSGESEAFAIRRFEITRDDVEWTKHDGHGRVSPGIFEKQAPCA